LEFLKLFYHALELPHEAAAMNVFEALSINTGNDDADLLAQKKLLMSAKDLYNKKKDYSVDVKACEDQVKLLEIQNKLDQVCDNYQHLTFF
jgi:peroxiredoxin family protein